MPYVRVFNLLKVPLIATGFPVGFFEIEFYGL